MLLLGMNDKGLRSWVIGGMYLCRLRSGDYLGWITDLSSRSWLLLMDYIKQPFFLKTSFSLIHFSFS